MVRSLLLLHTYDVVVGGFYRSPLLRDVDYYNFTHATFDSLMRFATRLYDSHGWSRIYAATFLFTVRSRSFTLPVLPVRTLHTSYVRYHCDFTTRSFGCCPTYIYARTTAMTADTRLFCTFHCSHRLTLFVRLVSTHSSFINLPPRYCTLLVTYHHICFFYVDDLTTTLPHTRCYRSTLIFR